MSKRKNQQDEFWVTNISDRNVCVADLGITIPARRSMNLLDSRHHYYTLEQLKQSAASGSLHAKKHYLFVRTVTPELIFTPGIHISKVPLFIAKQQLRSNVVLKEEQYEELAITVEQIVDEMTEE